MRLLGRENDRDQRCRHGRVYRAAVKRLNWTVSMALDQAHRHGVIHRDLKPGNIMLTEGGAMLLDFWLGKTLGCGFAELSHLLTPEFGAKTLLPFSYDQ